MTNHVMKGVLAARALVLAIAVTGVTVGPGGVAGSTPSRARMVSDGDALRSDAETVASRSHLGDRGGTAWDDETGSGDGGDSDDDDDEDDG